VFESAKAVRANYRNLRSFDLGLTLDGQSVSAASKSTQIRVQLSSVHESEDFAKRSDAGSNASAPIPKPGGYVDPRSGRALGIMLNLIGLLSRKLKIDGSTGSWLDDRGGQGNCF
jgi:hypothetical protein